MPQSTEMCILDFLRFRCLDLKDPICHGWPARGYQATKDFDCPSHASEKFLLVVLTRIVLVGVFEVVEGGFYPLGRFALIGSFTLPFAAPHSNSPRLTSDRFVKIRSISPASKPKSSPFHIGDLRRTLQAIGLNT
jgi:hypothetical protein